MATAARGTRAGSRPRAKSASARNASTRGRSQSEKRPKQQGEKRPKNSSANRNGGTARNGDASRNGSGSPQSVAIPFVTATLGAAAGVAGGVVLGRTALSRRKTDFTQLARQVGEAGRQFGKLAGEVRTASQKAAEVGKVLR